MTKARTQSGRMYSPESTAHHEAGHAVVGVTLGFTVKRATIVPSEGSLGVVNTGPLPAQIMNARETQRSLAPRERDKIERKIMSVLAGPAAEKRFLSLRTWRWQTAGWRGDVSTAIELASEVCGQGDESRRYFGWLRARTENLVGGPVVWRQIQHVAETLLVHKTLTGAQVRAAMKEAVAAAVGSTCSRRPVSSERSPARQFFATSPLRHSAPATVAAAPTPRRRPARRPRSARH